MKAIITLYRANGSIIGEPETREVSDLNDFDNINAEFGKLVENPDDEIAYFSLLGAN